MIIALENIRHDGVSYTPNDLIKDINKEDAERLVNLKVARFVDEVPEDNIKEDDNDIKKEDIDYKKELDERFISADLKEIAKELKIEFSSSTTKSDLVDLIIELGKAEEVLKFEVVEE